MQADNDAGQRHACLRTCARVGVACPYVLSLLAAHRKRRDYRNSRNQRESRNRVRLSDIIAAPCLACRCRCRRSRRVMPLWERPYGPACGLALRRCQAPTSLSECPCCCANCGMIPSCVSERASLRCTLHAHLPSLQAWPCNGFNSCDARNTAGKPSGQRGQRAAASRRRARSARSAWSPGVHPHRLPRDGGRTCRACRA